MESTEGSEIASSSSHRHHHHHRGGNKYTCDQHAEGATHICDTCDEFMCAKCVSCYISSGCHVKHTVALLEESLGRRVDLLKKSKRTLGAAAQVLEKKVADAEDIYKNDMKAVHKEVKSTADILRSQISDWENRCNQVLEDNLEDRRIAISPLKPLREKLEDIQKILQHEADNIGLEQDGLKAITRLLQIAGNVTIEVTEYEPWQMKAYLRGESKLTLGSVKVQTDSVIGGKQLSLGQLWEEVVALADGRPLCKRFRCEKELPEEDQCSVIMKPGARVRRGRDWKSTWDEHGCGLGTVVFVDDESVTVRWDCNTGDTYRYRIGQDYHYLRLA